MSSRCKGSISCNMTKAFFSDFRGFRHRVDDVTRWSSIECQGAPQPIEIGFVRSYCQSSIVKLINGDGKVKKSGDVTEEIDASIAQMTRQVLFGWRGGRFVTASSISSSSVLFICAIR